MNRPALLFALTALGMFTAGCSQRSSTPKVALLLSTLQEERYQKDQRYFEEAARRRGLTPFTLSADNDNARQLGQVEDALSRGAKVLVIQPTDSAAASTYIERAHERGAKVVAYDRDIRPGAQGGADYYVAHDAYRIGVLQAEAALRASGNKGKYILLHGQSGHSVAGEISRGYMETLRPHLDQKRVEIVAEKHHDSWSPEQALKTVEDALVKSKGDVQAILASNSGMARGAVQAIEAAGLSPKKIFVAGSDADAANISFLCQGKQTVEVLKEIQPLAEKAVEVAYAFVSGNAPTGKVAYVPVRLVTPETVKTLIVDSGFHSQAALSGCK